MKRSIVAIAVALVLAVLGAGAVLLYARDANSRALAGQKAVQVLVATRTIPAGTTGALLREGAYTTLVTMPAATVPEDALRYVDGSLSSLALTSDVAPRQLLLRGAFDLRGNSTGLHLKEGQVAVSVEVTVPAEVAGYVLPGVQVAVFDTYTVADSGTRVPAGDGLASNHAYNKATRLLVSGVEVLAVGARGGAGSADLATTTGTTKTATSQQGTVLLTLAATQAQAERLIHGTVTGSLYLALMTSSSGVAPGAGVDNNSLFN
jgi:pilus assembly protein CpaB